jgi:hypothetical protein
VESPVLVDGLTKTFKVPVRETGLRQSIRSLFNREFQDVEADGGGSGSDRASSHRLPCHLERGIRNYSGASA